MFIKAFYLLIYSSFQLYDIVFMHTFLNCADIKLKNISDWSLNNFCCSLEKVEKYSDSE